MTPVTGLSEEQIMVLAEQISASVRRPERRDWNRPIQVAIGVLALVSLIFSAGLNWSRIGNVEQRITVNEKRIEELDKQQRDFTAVQADQRSDIREISVRLAGIAADLSEIKGRLNVR